MPYKTNRIGPEKSEFKYIFDLPVELRAYIYEFAFEGGRCCEPVPRYHEGEKVGIAYFAWNVLESKLDERYKIWRENPGYRRESSRRFYHLSFSDCRPWLSERWPRLCQTLDLLLVCRKIYDEARLLPFKCITFAFSEWEDLGLFCRRLSAAQAAALQSLYYQGTSRLAWIAYRD
ncbi:hypothetical protein K490DRAFT_55210 [Saccharata proteae CBS 121410]|uniref:Uncharacterized protein n=1 Tax=Saccharata proteae CBS 121410 TaxID=1314787 RepID=A0A6A5YFM5_9PEZI|nr:hypothetical protein K490DRAFT_55210 [Saccharata proteae CBS 121410]